MNRLFGIIAASVFVCSLAAPARAELSETAAAGEVTQGHPLSAPEKGGGQAGIISLLDRFAGTGLSDRSPEERNDSSLSTILPISETTVFSACTRADSPMNAYYSRLGSDDKGKITAISRSEAFAAFAGNNLSILSDMGLAADIQGHFVGSGVVVGEAGIPPMQAASSGQSIIRTSDNPGNGSPTVPLPLPFLLTGSGLAALLGLKKRAGIQIRRAERIC